MIRLQTAKSHHEDMSTCPFFLFLAKQKLPCLLATVQLDHHSRDGSGPPPPGPILLSLSDLSVPHSAPKGDPGNPPSMNKRLRKKGDSLHGHCPRCPFALSSCLQEPWSSSHSPESLVPRALRVQLSLLSSTAWPTQDTAQCWFRGGPDSPLTATSRACTSMGQQVMAQKSSGPVTHAESCTESQHMAWLWASVGLSQGLEDWS